MTPRSRNSVDDAATKFAGNRHTFAPCANISCDPPAPLVRPFARPRPGKGTPHGVPPAKPHASATGAWPGARLKGTSESV